MPNRSLSRTEDWAIRYGAYHGTRRRMLKFGLREWLTPFNSRKYTLNRAWNVPGYIPRYAVLKRKRFPWKKWEGWSW
jgi:hypothetical protein